MALIADEAEFQPHWKSIDLQRKGAVNPRCCTVGGAIFEDGGSYERVTGFTVYDGACEGEALGVNSVLKTEKEAQ